MNIKIEAANNISIVRCVGSLDADSVAGFKKATTELVNRGEVRLVVDFTDLTFIDSMGLGVLISLLRRAREQSGDVKVAALTSDVKTIFEITRLHRLFDIYVDAPTACRMFK